MSLPTSYDEATLAAFMVTELSTTATALGWTTSSPAIAAAVDEVASLIGALADQSDVTKVRNVARWQAWSAAQGAAASRFDIASGRSSLKRSQWFDMISRKLLSAEGAALQYEEVQTVVYGASMKVGVHTVYTMNSPYGYPDCLMDGVE